MANVIRASMSDKFLLAVGLLQVIAVTITESEALSLKMQVVTPTPTPIEHWKWQSLNPSAVTLITGGSGWMWKRDDQSFFSADQLFYNGMVKEQNANAIIYSTPLNQKSSKYGEQFDPKFLHDLTRENLDDEKEKKALDYCLKAFKVHWGKKRTELHDVEVSETVGESVKVRDVRLPATVDELQALLEQVKKTRAVKERKEGINMTTEKPEMQSTDWITTDEPPTGHLDRFIIHSNIRSCMQTVTLGPDDWVFAPVAMDFKTLAGPQTGLSGGTGFAVLDGFLWKALQFRDENSGKAAPSDNIFPQVFVYNAARQDKDVATRLVTKQVKDTDGAPRVSVGLQTFFANRWYRATATFCTPDTADCKYGFKMTYEDAWQSPDAMLGKVWRFPKVAGIGGIGLTEKQWEAVKQVTSFCGSVTAATLQSEEVDTVQSQPVDPSPSPVITVDAMSQRGGEAWINALPSFEKVKKSIIDFFPCW